MSRVPMVLTALATLLAAANLYAANPQAAAANSQAAPPNIVIVLVDDMGWSDLGCYGGEVQTPQVDALAAAGLRFSAFYNTGRCCPTRASLLTGLYPHRAGVGRMTFDDGLPGYRGELARNAATIAECLRPAGYRTGMVGKWHLSLTVEEPGHMPRLDNQTIAPTFANPASYPVGRGFDSHYGVIWGVVNHFDPFSLVQDRQPVPSVPPDYYDTDAYTAHAVEFVAAADDRPFFLYLAYTAPHWPLHARPEEIAKYENVYAAGWQAVREARYRRQTAAGLLDPATCNLSEAFAPGADWNQNPDRAWDARAMAVHAAMIDRVDAGVGQLVQALRTAGRLDNTLLLFLSDNGASREEPSEPGFDRTSETRDGRPMVYFGGGKPKAVLPGPETTYAGIGPLWANVANTPLRRFKATPYEGGIRTPLVVHWPAGLTTPPGSLTAARGHVIDLLPTCLEAAGAKVLEQVNGEATQQPDGVSLLPVFRGAEFDRPEPLFFEHFGGRAVIDAGWKLVGPPGQPWELYHLDADESETQNLAATQPQRVRTMAAAWEAWAKSAAVLPRP